MDRYRYMDTYVYITLVWGYILRLLKSSHYIGVSLKINTKKDCLA